MPFEAASYSIEPAFPRLGVARVHKAYAYASTHRNLKSIYLLRPSENVAFRR